jgi:O-antigen/teichoic acid export membrane protein
LQWMALTVLPTALLVLHAQGLQGLKRIRDANLVGSLGVPVFSLLGVFALVPRWGVLGAVWAYVLAAILTSAAGLWLWRRATPQLSAVEGRVPTAELLQSSMPLFGVAALQLITTWTSTLALGIWASSADVGVFGVASRTAALTSFVLISINSIAAPKFAALHKQGDLLTLRRIARKSTKLMALLASPVLVSFLLFPSLVLSIFGAGFSSAATVLSILAVGQFVNVITGSVGFLLSMCGYERLLRNNLAVCAALNVALNMVLVPRHGAVGAAIATAVTLALQMLIATAMVWQKLGVVTIPFWYGRSEPL